MVTTGTHTDPVVALAQQTPPRVTIDQDAALVEDPLQQQRRVGLHSLQLGDVNRMVDDTLQADGEDVRVVVELWGRPPGFEG